MRRLTPLGSRRYRLTPHRGSLVFRLNLLSFALLPPHLAFILLRNCDAARDPLACRLDSILHVLYGAAFILGIVLLVVLWAAFRLYKRHRSRRTVVGEDD